jgi:hypothetical protein
VILFFEGLRSERQLRQVVADRLSLRWYRGDDLGESLPDHSSLTRIRDRYGLEVFRRFFEGIVEQCLEAGLVWGRERYVDATKVEANASLDSVGPRVASEAHLAALCAAPEAGAPDDDADRGAMEPVPRPVALSVEARAALAEAAAHRHDWIGEAGRPDRTLIRGEYRRTADFRASIPLPDVDGRTAFFGKGEFVSDPDHDASQCPGGQRLPCRTHNHTERVRISPAHAAACPACSLKTQGPTRATGRQVKRRVADAYRDRVRRAHPTEA